MSTLTRNEHGQAGMCSFTASALHCMQCITATAGGIEGEVAAGEGESRKMDTRTMGACGERNWRGGLGYNDGPPAVGGATGAPQQESNMGRWACALLRPALVMRAVPAWAIEEEVATGEGRSRNMDTKTMGACGATNW